MLEQFKEYRPQAATKRIIDRANSIIEEYLDQGFKLTARQLFYQFVARGWLPNTTRNYKMLYRILGDARDGGLVDWDAIEDRTRKVHTHPSWNNPRAIISAAAKSYREDRWIGQRYRPEVWIEKDALLGVIEGVCTEYRVPYFATRGNCSQTLLYEAGERFAEYIDQGLIPLVLHLADHDPNGIDMTRDLQQRLQLYTGVGIPFFIGHRPTKEPIEVRRIALNLDQVEQHQPPPNTTKEGDSRTSGYRERFGTDECWELDALSPEVIAELIRDELEELIDEDKWHAAERQELSRRTKLKRVAENWTKVEKLLRPRRRQ